MNTDRPAASSPAVSRRMAIHPRRDTGPEIVVRRALHAAGKRYRVCWKVPGAPRRTIDIAFTRAKVAVFIDGCFWHGCPEHGQTPVSNREWWIKKIDKNRARDDHTTRLLQEADWVVLRFWEHEDPAGVVQAILEAAGRARSGVPSAPVHRTC